MMSLKWWSTHISKHVSFTEIMAKELLLKTKIVSISDIQDQPAHSLAPKDYGLDIPFIKNLLLNIDNQYSQDRLHFMVRKGMVTQAQLQEVLDSILAGDNVQQELRQKRLNKATRFVGGL